MGNKRPRRNSYKQKNGLRYSGLIRCLAFPFKIITGISIVLVISLFFILIHSFLIQSDYFRIKDIQVSGVSRFSKAEIIKQAGIEMNENLLSINLSHARKRLLADLSISEAEVTRHLPGRIFIRIKEHMPFAELDFGRRFIINSEGKIFKELDNSDPRCLPLITGLKISDFNSSGECGSIYYDAVLEVLKLGKKAGNPVPIETLVRIHVDKEIGLTLYTDKGALAGLQEIKLGYNDYANKYIKLKKVYLYLKKTRGFTDFCSIDLDNLNRMVLTPATGKKEV